jgi:NaMN:DMB phosphoribosyltransferase
LTRPPILFATAPDRGKAFASRWAGKRPAFCCVLAHTDTCLIPGVSAAGISEELRPYTPAADAEVVLLGAPRCLPRLPSNPLGAAGPSGITRAALQLAGIEAVFIGAGLRVWPETPCERVDAEPGGNIECGTTTGLALLLALGVAAEGRVSGSQVDNAHDLKTRVARTALNTANLTVGSGRDDPLKAVIALGDPMQPLAAGIARGAVEAGCDVLLAGGSQMLAVAALIAALHGPDALNRIAIGTTRWIVQDPAADIAGLADDIAPDLSVLAANLDFSNSRHPGLRSYEQWLVKEGVGAGGASIAALLASGAPIEHLQEAIDATYDGLLGRLSF